MTTAALLQITGPGHSGPIVELSDTTTIGRAPDNDIVLDDDTVSRCHAMLLMQPEGMLLVDLDSTNGTFVNGVLALPDEPVHLTDGDVVTMGSVMLRYQARS
jgi:pSer/pThr/pTyr-binding forkhead associated (FHA) protein